LFDNTVVKVLPTQDKVNSNRLKYQWVGFWALVTSNKTEEGQAKNHRVEWVEQLLEYSKKGF
jgi:outer membrane protein OmpA-like peptidoglycan-associated protein